MNKEKELGNKVEYLGKIDCALMTEADYALLVNGYFDIICEMILSKQDEMEVQKKGQ